MQLRVKTDRRVGSSLAPVSTHFWQSRLVKYALLRLMADVHLYEERFIFCFGGIWCYFTHCACLKIYKI